VAVYGRASAPQNVSAGQMERLYSDCQKYPEIEIESDNESGQLTY
jgi:hypothetical protein